MPDTLTRHAIFRQLHQRGNPFVLVNVWDVGGARLMESLGAKAIATSSAALAFTLGKTDGTLTIAEALKHAGDLVQAVDIPVSGDFENGYGDTPSDMAQTIRMAADVGLSGISIEDTALPTNKPYPFALAVARIEAAAAAVSTLCQEFMLVARADGVMHGTYDGAEAKRRLAAFEQAGAGCLYAPMLSLPDTAEVCQSTALPVNVLISGENIWRQQQTFAEMGVARLSLGSTLARAVHRLYYDAAQAMLRDGNFTPLTNGIDSDLIDDLISR